MTKIKQYFENQSYQEAITFLESAIDLDSGANLLRLYLGLAWFLFGDFAQGEAIWFAAILESEDREKTVNDLVNILAEEVEFQLQKRNFILAQKLSEQIIDLDDSNYIYYFNLGNALAQNGDYEGAIIAWKQAIKLNPNCIEAYQNIGDYAHHLGEYTEAINVYEKLLEIESNNVEIVYKLGLCYCLNKEGNKAITYFEKCLELNPNFSQVYGDLGYLYLLQERIKDGISSWQKIAQINPKWIEDYLTWANNITGNNQQIQPPVLRGETKGNSVREEILFPLLKGDNQEIINNAQLLNSLAHNQSFSDICLNLGDFFTTRGVDNLANLCYQFTDLGKIKNELKDLDSTNKNITNTQNRVKPPQGYYETAKEWALKFNLLETNYYPIYPESKISLKPPNTKDKYIHYSYRFGEELTLPASFLVVIENGRFWLREDQASSAVMTPDNHIIGDLSPESPALSPNHPDKHPSKHSIFKRDYLPEIQDINDTVVVLAGLLNDVYFHWMFDILPRIELLKKSGLDLEQIGYFLISNKLPFQQESLELLGIPQNKILKIEDYQHIRAKKLIVPSFQGIIAWMTKNACKFLRDTFICEEKLRNLQPTKKLYIRRNQASNRRLINEDELIDLLKKYDFEAVNLESMTIKQQAELLAQAKVIISPHGSGLTNLVFCQPGTKVIEILSPYYVYHCYWLVSNLVGLEYHYILGDNPEGYFLHKLLYPDVREEDIYINIEESIVCSCALAHEASL
jgi:tetratricopeptide (TPR) repeat protein